MLVVPEALAIAIVSGGTGAALLKIVEKIVTYVGDSKAVRLKSKLEDEAAEQKAAFQMQTFVQSQLVAMEEELSSFREKQMDDVNEQLERLRANVESCRKDLEECRDTVNDRLKALEDAVKIRRIARMDKL